MVSICIENQAPIDDQVYAIHIHATSMTVSKTQTIVLYKLYRCKSEVKLEVII